jgi:cysteine desulfurase
LDPIDLHGTLRFSFGRFNTIEEVKKAVSIIKSSVSKLRAFSPLYNKKESN